MARRTYAGRTAEVEEILGYHLQEAHRTRVALGPADDAARELAGRAATHLLAAGCRALNRNDYRGAVNLLGRAHALSERPGADLLLAYGSALANRGSLGRGLGVLQAAIEAAAGAGDERLAWHARIEEIKWRGQVDTRAGVAAEILNLVPKAIPLLEGLGDDTGAARAWMAIATAHNNVGRHAMGLEAAERALEHGERAGNESLVLGAYRLIGVAVIWGPVPLAEAFRRYGDLIDRVDGGPLKRVAATEVVAALKTQLGHVAEARALIARARELYEELGDALSGAKTPSSITGGLSEREISRMRMRFWRRRARSSKRRERGAGTRPRSRSERRRCTSSAAWTRRSAPRRRLRRQARGTTL